MKHASLHALATLAAATCLVACPRTNSMDADAAMADAGPSPYRDAGAPLLTESWLCQRASDASFLGWFPIAPGVDTYVSRPLLSAGVWAGGTVAFGWAATAERGEGGAAGVVFPFEPEPVPPADDDRNVFLFRDPAADPYRVPTPGFTAMGSALVLVDPWGDNRQIVMLDPVRRSPRIARELPGAPAPGETIAIAARDGGLLVTWGDATLLRLGGSLEPDGPPDTLAIPAEQPRLVRTDAGMVWLAPGVCGLLTTWLDAEGRPADAPICVSSVPEQRAVEPIWDGARIVVPYDGGIQELDGRGRGAGWTPVDGTALAAIGTREGLLALVRPTDDVSTVELRLVERRTGALLRSLGSDGPGPYAILSGAAAVSSGEAFMVFHIDYTGRLDPIEIACD